MAAQARLFGLPGFAVQECRMLELGCGDGGNLLPLAAAFPQATFVGLDLSGGAIERGRALAQEAGLANVRLEQADLGTVDAGSLGRFHAVAAHGVYSWVPAAVRDRLMALVGACLERDGVAYVSYNALPGGHLRALVRDVLRLHVAGLRDAQERLAAARELLRTLPSLSAWRGGALEAHVKRALERDDAGLFHDEIAEVNDAVHVSALDTHAREHGLRYFTEAVLSATVDGPRSDAVRRALDEHGDDRLAREQHLDLLELRLYRESLLCREGARPWPEPRPTHAGALHAAGRLRSKRPRTGVEEFRSPQGGSLSTDHPALKAAFGVLADAWP